MGFFGRMGSKIGGGLANATRFGIKALGTVHRIGNKIAHTGNKVIHGIESVPILGAMATPITSVARTGIGLVQNVANVAGGGEKMLREGQDIVRAGADALRTGDVAGAMAIKRRAEDLTKDGRSQLERAREVSREAIALSKRA